MIAVTPAAASIASAVRGLRRAPLLLAGQAAHIYPVAHRGALVVARAAPASGPSGSNSRIARLAGAKTYHDHPPVTFAYYTYWRGCPVAGVHAWLEPGRFFGIFPVGGGLALAFVQGPRGEYPTFRRDPRTAYVSELRSRPALAGLLADAVIAEPLRGSSAAHLLPGIVGSGLGAGR